MPNLRFLEKLILLFEILVFPSRRHYYIMDTHNVVKIGDDMKGRFKLYALLAGILPVVLLSLYMWTSAPQVGASKVELPQASGATILQNKIEEFLSPYTQDTVLTKEVASAVLSEAFKTGLPPELILSIIIYESSVQPKAVSIAGALGLMQVMPLHVPIVGCDVRERADLFIPRRNICAGVSVLVQVLERCNNNARCALLAYNGCIVREGLELRQCYSYPDRVEESVLAFLTEE